MNRFILILAFLAFNIASAQTIITTSATTSGTISGNSLQQNHVVIHDAGVTLTLTLALPPNPVDGQLFAFTSVGGVTTLTLSSVVGTIQNSITTLAAGGNATYMYSATNNKWYKIR